MKKQKLKSLSLHKKSIPYPNVLIGGADAHHGNGNSDASNWILHIYDDIDVD